MLTRPKLIGLKLIGPKLTRPNDTLFFQIHVLIHINHAMIQPQFAMPQHIPLFLKISRKGDLLTWDSLSVPVLRLKSLLAPVLFIPVLLFLLSGCGPTAETILVEERARSLEEPDLPDTIIDRRDDDLSVLRIADINRIRSLDPLFAVNTATRRVIQLAYEGLVRLDEDDRIQMAAAHRWDVSNDLLTYTFTIRRDLFFHNDESFTQGRGRRVNSHDVVRVFKRMAERDVPPDAAELFINSILGFEAYYLEQREVYFEADREVTGIPGIRAVNDSTVVFHLIRRDPDFLKKLASPYAVIYPSEPFRFRNDGLHRHAVGTGPFRFHASRGDSLFIFVPNQNYYRKDEDGRSFPRVQRLEVMSITDEHRLFDSFRNERLDMILDPGLYALYELTDENRNLKPEFADRYQLEGLAGHDPLVLRYNTRNRFELHRSDAAAAVRHADGDGIRAGLNYPALEVSSQDRDFSQVHVGRVFQRFGQGQGNYLLLAYTQDYLPRVLGNYLHETIDDNLNSALIQRRVFSRDIFLYLDHLQAIYPGQRHPVQEDELLRVEAGRYILAHATIAGWKTNSMSWWLDLNTVHARQPQR